MIVVGIRDTGTMHTITWEPHGLIRRLYGRSNWSEFYELSISTQADPRYDNVRYIIIDVLDWSHDGLAVSQDEIDELAAITAVANQRLPKDTQVAVVTRDQRVCELAERFRTSRYANRRYGVFSTVDAARAWCDHPETA